MPIEDKAVMPRNMSSKKKPKPQPNRPANKPTRATRHISTRIPGRNEQFPYSSY